MQNLNCAKESFTPHFNHNLDQENIDKGKANARGLEILLRKKTGGISGWIAYNLNQVVYNFPSLNEGKIFLADHNKTHELKSVIVTRVWGLDFTANWVLSSGGPYTSRERLFVEPGSGYGIKIIGDRNERRLGAVHHLDINISKSLKINTAIIDVGCSIYNVYNQNNISHKRYNPYTSQLSVKDVSMFGITPNAYIKIRLLM